MRRQKSDANLMCLVVALVCWLVVGLFVCKPVADS